MQSNNNTDWLEFKGARNTLNKAIKVAKKNYFTTGLEGAKNDSKKTWKLINEAKDRQTSRSRILDIKTENGSVDEVAEISGGFNPTALLILELI